MILLIGHSTLIIIHVVHFITIIHVVLYGLSQRFVAMIP